MVKGLDHIIIAVENLASSSARWQALLGVAPVWQGEHPEQGTQNVLFNFSDFYLELMAATGEGGHAQRLRLFMDKNGEGIFGLCLRSDDIDATAKSLGTQVASGEGTATSSDKKRKWKLAIAPLDKTEGLFIFAIEHLSPPLPLLENSDISTLDHSVIMTSRPDEIKTFLADRLGLPLALDQTKEDFGLRQLFFKLGGRKFLEVAKPLKGGEQTENKFWGMAWRTDDIEATHARLTESGAFNLSQVRAGRKAGTQVFTVRDAPNAIPTLIINHP